MKRKTIILLLLVAAQVAYSQNKTNSIIVRGMIVGQDTLPVIDLPTFIVMDMPKFKNARDAKRFDKLARNVKRVYPYAKAAGNKFNEYNTLLTTIQDEKARKKMMKKAEDEIMSQYEAELRKLSITQGKILIKLLDRETSHTSYELLKDFRGTIMAVFWQGIGRVFGYNLKTGYDPSKGEDKEIELIIQLIDAGYL
jgi:hypothetical protein